MPTVLYPCHRNPYSMCGMRSAVEFVLSHRALVSSSHSCSEFCWNSFIGRQWSAEARRIRLPRLSRIDTLVVHAVAVLLLPQHFLFGMWCVYSRFFAQLSWLWARPRKLFQVNKTRITLRCQGVTLFKIILQFRYPLSNWSYSSESVFVVCPSVKLPFLQSPCFQINISF